MKKPTIEEKVIQAKVPFHRVRFEVDSVKIPNLTDVEMQAARKLIFSNPESKNIYNVRTEGYLVEKENRPYMMYDLIISMKKRKTN